MKSVTNLVCLSLTILSSCAFAHSTAKVTNGSQVKSDEPLPIVRIEPRYPMKAARDGLQGDVILMFTVGKLGQVKDIKVLDAQPKGVFDRAAIKALSKWKYRPKVKDGQPVEQNELITTLSFRLAQ